MMKRIVLDTNALLRFLLNDNTAQADEVESLLKKAQEEKIQIAIPQVVIFELLFALEKFYKVTKTEAVAKIKSILSTDYVSVQDRSVFKYALKEHERSTLSGVDCFLLGYAKEKQAVLFTFDKKLIKRTIQ